MKILHVIPAVARRYGGPSVAVVELCRALRAKGQETLIAATDADGPGRRLDVGLDEPSEFGGVPAVFFSRVAGEAFKYSPTLAAWLKRNVANFDVLHVHGVMSHACLAAVTAARRAGVPVVLRPLGTLDAWSLGQKPVRKRLFMALAGHSMVRSVSVIHATSPREAEEIRRGWQVDAIEVIPLGVEEAWLERPLNDAEPDPPYVVSVSRIHRVKGLTELVDAFARAVTASPRPWRLKIAGDGEPGDVKALRDHIAASTVADRVDLVGWVEGPTKTTLVANASVFALASAHENFGLGLAGAMALGVPVLATPGAHLAVWIEGARAGWIGGGAVSLSDALADALADAGERRQRGLNGRALAAEWRWSATAERLVDVYGRARVAAVAERAGLRAPMTTRG